MSLSIAELHKNLRDYVDSSHDNVKSFIIDRCNLEFNNEYNREVYKGHLSFKDDKLHFVDFIVEADTGNIIKYDER